MPDSPCHGDAQRLTPVIPAGQKPISVRLRRAVQPRHRRVSLLILKSSLLILNSGVRNNALTWSPVTESNRRPSPYHGRSFGLEGSRWVASVQFRTVALSGWYRRGPVLTGAVVTRFVTGFPDLTTKGEVPYGSPNRRRLHDRRV